MCALKLVLMNGRQLTFRSSSQCSKQEHVSFSVEEGEANNVEGRYGNALL